jgi:7,8-dihydro-6-hydroxymethylpterin dimethyltransferase
MPSDDKSACSNTYSLCPICLTRVRAVRFPLGNNIHMKKTCPEHGEFQVTLWRGSPSYEGWVRPKVPCLPKNPTTVVDRSCPYDCGLCPDHRQQTCTALLEVTQRCNLRCAFCFADSDTSRSPDPDMGTIRSWFESLRASGNPCNIQLSGGEPTIREDLPKIIALGRSMGFGFVQVNTNGLRLSADPAYLERLADAGLASVFLQFDGMNEDIHQKLRGGFFLKEKMIAIENCRQQGLGVVLVPTVVPGVNDNELGSIVQFALENLDVVRGVHFQPVSYFGRYPVPPSDADRITIPEVIRKLEIQTEGVLKAQDFKPPGCENALCSFHGSFVLMPDGSVRALTSHSSSNCRCNSESAEQGASNARKFVAQNWSGRESNTPSHLRESFSMGEWDVLLERASTHMLCISGMAFQDVWNIDLDRLRDCCIHVVSRDGMLIPFCAYNLTDSAGRSLYGRG